jgi:hypothetical protein
MSSYHLGYQFVYYVATQDRSEVPVRVSILLLWDKAEEHFDEGVNDTPIPFGLFNELYKVFLQHIVERLEEIHCVVVRPQALAIFIEFNAA